MLQCCLFVGPAFGRAGFGIAAAGSTAAAPRKAHWRAERSPTPAGASSSRIQQLSFSCAVADGEAGRMRAGKRTGKRTEAAAAEAAGSGCPGASAAKRHGAARKPGSPESPEARSPEARSPKPEVRKPEARSPKARRLSSHGERRAAAEHTWRAQRSPRRSRRQQQQETAAFFFLCCCFCGCRLSAAAARAKSTDVMVVLVVVLVDHQRRRLSSLVVYMIMRLPNLMMNTSLSVGAPHSGFPLPKQMSLTSKAMDGAFL